MNKKYLEIFIYISITIFCFLYLICKFEVFDAISYSSTGSLIISSLYSKWFWKYNLFEKTPRLCNGYIAKLEYVYEGKKQSKKVKVNIYQDLFSVRVIMQSNESFSKSVIANIYKEQEVWYLTYTYINEPSQKNRDRSKIHYGTCKLNLEDLENIKGEYFTDRHSSGDMSFIKSKEC
ncbi:MAG: hypothetical protein ACI4PE_00165 [Bacilli bacterium]